MLKREKHLLDKQETSEVEIVRQMEMGLKDPSAFNQWRNEMDRRDEVLKLEYLLKKKIEGEMSREQAIQAQLKAKSDNANLAKDIKHEIERLLEVRDNDMADKIRENKEIIKGVHLQH